MVYRHIRTLYRALIKISSATIFSCSEDFILTRMILMELNDAGRELWEKALLMKMERFSGF